MEPRDVRSDLLETELLPLASIVHRDELPLRDELSDTPLRSRKQVSDMLLGEQLGRAGEEVYDDGLLLRSAASPQNAHSTTVPACNQQPRDPRQINGHNGEQHPTRTRVQFILN